jgi:hypothetical protein
MNDVHEARAREEDQDLRNWHSDRAFSARQKRWAAQDA